MAVVRVVSAEEIAARGESRAADPLRMLLAECGLVEEPTFTLSCEDTYFDSWDGRLRRKGQRLRHRAGENRWYLDAGPERMADQSGRGGAIPSRGAVRKALGKLPARRRLFPQLVVRRSERVFRSSDAGAALSMAWSEFDFRDPCDGRTVPGPRVLSLDRDDAAETADDSVWNILLSRMGGASSAGFDPFTAGLEALRIPIPGAAPPEALRVRGEDPLPGAARKILRRQMFQLRQHVRGAYYDLDPEYVHQLRVASRRARAALRLFGPRLDPGRCDALRRELGWFGRSLGRMRDLDVLKGDLPAQLEKARATPAAATAVLEAVERRRLAAHREVRKALESDRFTDMLRGLEAAVPDSAGGVEPVAEVSPAMIRKALRRVLKWRKADANRLPVEDLHRIRIHFKRLRYVGEFLADFHPPGFGESIRKLVAFQDCLGEFNDAGVAAAHIRAIAEVELSDKRWNVDTMLALGALMLVQRRKEEARRREFETLWERFPGEAKRLRDRILQS